MNQNNTLKSNFPKISIVTPSYNQGEFIEATIDSILSQNYPNLEYIIIDGGSTDNSVEIIKKYEKYLYFWCSETDKGQYDAINKGFSHSTGEIMAYLSSDDMYYPWTFKTVGSIFSDLPEVEWISSLSAGSWDYHGYCMPFYQITGFSKDGFLEGDYHPSNSPQTRVFIQQECTFWRRSLWEKIGSNIRIQFNLAGDFDLWTQFYLHANLYGVNCPLAGNRKHEEKRSLNQENYIKEASKSLKEMREVEKWQPNSWRKLVRDLKPYVSAQIYKKLQYKIAYSKFGYEAHKINRINHTEKNGLWAVEKYKFFM